ncbi:MAG: geranylgeranyl reductase family protein [Propionibacteriaceae bacterium]|jgi:geranylgeranyl reductase family protein|nr:geranylgeranyl reductase family protein [Propionibacteriaceae bacterium]
MSEIAVCDVVVVGAGPAGAATAAYLAGHGVDVVLLDKAEFPRAKACGDGLTPRAVKQLVRLGVDISDEKAWPRNQGLRVYGGRYQLDTEALEIPWPELIGFPAYGLVKRREEFDNLLVSYAVSKGARFISGVTVEAALVENGRVVGVQAAGETKQTFRAAVVVAADGAASRVAKSLGVEADRRKPMGVAVRGRYQSPRAGESWMESWLELRDAKGGLLPGYGWVFPEGGGSCNVGLGVLQAGDVNVRKLLGQWLEGLPVQWQFDDVHLEGHLASAALPMCLNRGVLYKHGLLFVGDSAGMVSPFNGEGIAYALEAASFAAAAIVDAKARGFGTPSAEQSLRGYGIRVHEEWVGYFQLGRVFAALIGKPEIMRICTRYGLPHPSLMRFTMKLLAHLFDRSGGDWMDRVISYATKAASLTAATTPRPRGQKG